MEITWSDYFIGLITYYSELEKIVETTNKANMHFISS